MQISSRFTISIHLLVFLNYAKDIKVTSKMLAASIGVNPVVIRDVMGKLKKAGLIISNQGKSGIELARPLDQITFDDVFLAIDSISTEGLFHFHEHPNQDCPVGRNIHVALDDRLHHIQQQMEAQMKNITVADVMADIEKQIKIENRKER